MISDELEKLIEIACADGEISEKELAVLHKRAQAEGVDIDELDMILKAKLQKDKESEARQQAKNNAVLDLMAQIESLVEQYPPESNDDDKDTINDKLADKIESKLEHLIGSFIIPTEKSLLLLFIAQAKSFKRKNVINSSRDTDEILGSAFRKRYKDAIKMVQSLYPGDPEFVNLIGDDAIPKDQREKKGFFSRLFGK